MAKRTWLVRADSEVSAFGVHDGELVQTGVIAAVSQQELHKAVAEGVVLLERAGGTLAVTINRIETGIPQECVTGAALVEWKDRTDARPQPESTEDAIGLPPEVHAEPVVGEDGVVRHAEEAEIERPDVDWGDVPVELRA